MDKQNVSQALGVGVVDGCAEAIPSPNPPGEEVRANKTAIRLYAATIPDKYRPLYEKVASSNATPRQCIKAKCQECVGYEGVVNRIQNCSVQNCPLWGSRPYQTFTEVIQDEQNEI